MAAAEPKSDSDLTKATLYLARYRVSFVRILEKIDSVITAPHGMYFPHNAHYRYNTIARNKKGSNAMEVHTHNQ